MARGWWYGAMAERDPFGRLPDENPLAGLGALSDGTTSQSAEPVVVAAEEDWSGGEPGARAKPASSEQPRPAPPPRASSQPRTGNPALDQSIAEAIRQAEAMSGVKVAQSVRTVGRVVKLVVFLVVIGVVASVAKPLIDAGKDVRDAVGDIDLPSVTTPGVVGEAEGERQSGTDREAPAPTGLSSNSMLVKRNFGPAMSRLSKAGLGRMRTLSIRPERVDAQLLTKGGSLRSVQIRFDNRELDDFGAGSPGFSQLDTIPFAKIDTAAPGRLARSAAGRLRKPVSQIDYVVLTGILNRVVWLVYSKSGKAFQANAHGKIVRRIN